MLNVGLTGNIASGKSTVAQHLALLGAFVIDADALAREAVKPGSPALAAVRAQFGESLMTADGRLDRSALRNIVFQDDQARNRLNAIVHPAVGALRQREFEMAAGRGATIVISDIPLLFEVGLETTFDAIILVDAADKVRLARLMRRNALPEADAMAMMSAQQPAFQKRAKSMFVIDNDGTFDKLIARVEAVWQQLQTLASTVQSTQ